MCVLHGVHKALLWAIRHDSIQDYKEGFNACFALCSMTWYNIQAPIYTRLILFD